MSFGSVRQIKLANRYVFDAYEYLLVYRIVS